MEEPKTIKSEPVAPDAQSWHEYIWREQQGTPARLEDTAKFLTGIISISLTLFLSIGKSIFENFKNSPAIKWAVIIWLISLLVSFFVLFPWRYKYVSQSVEDIKRVHRMIVHYKRTLLVISLLLYFISSCILTVTLCF